MEQDSYYFRVGLFVAISFVTAMAAIGWFSSEKDASGHTPYAIYFNGAVDGLLPGAPVKLRGIQVGFVRDVAFSSSKDVTIRVIANILNASPISTNTRASLQMQGITGSSFISLENLAEPSNPLTRKDTDHYLIIESRQSSLERVFTTVPELIDQMTKLAVQGQKVLSDDNAKAINETLTSVNSAVQAVGKLVGTGNKGEAIQGTLTELAEMIAEAKTTLREIRMLARTLREDPSIIVHGVKQEGVKLP
jgi:phospholipid/cholesterol/gamma-HCH transport system substrate-binding protein